MKNIKCIINEIFFLVDMVKIKEHDNPFKTMNDLFTDFSTILKGFFKSESH